MSLKDSLQRTQPGRAHGSAWGDIKHWIRLRETDLYKMFPYTFQAKSKPGPQGHTFFASQKLTLESLHTTQKIAVIAGHQPELTKVPKSLSAYFDELKSLGFQTIFINAISEPIITTQRTLSLKLPKSLDFYLERENLGHDFGSWADFSRLLKQQGLSFSQFQQVILANDSVIGPVAPLQPLLKTIEETNSDLVGLTDSPQRVHHLQSYFIVFQKNALTSGYLDQRFLAMPYYHHKPLLIIEQEAQAFLPARLGPLKYEALFPYKEIWSQNPFDLRELNPSQVYAKILIDEKNFPFVKKELLRKNPFHLEFVDALGRRENIQLLMELESYVLEPNR